MRAKPQPGLIIRRSIFRIRLPGCSWSWAQPLMLTKRRDSRGTGPNGRPAVAAIMIWRIINNQADTIKASIMSTKAGELGVVRRIFRVDKTNQEPSS